MPTNAATALIIPLRFMIFNSAILLRIAFWLMRLAIKDFLWWILNANSLL